MRNTSIITYSIEDILKIGENITAILNEDIINKLLEIKQNNRFIKKTSPIKLQYVMKVTVANKWRQEKINNELSIIDQFKENINSNLNKISEKNFEIIKNNIIKLIDSENKEYRDILLELIFVKTISESQFSNIYVKLIKEFNKIYGISFKKILFTKINNFYNENISLNLNTQNVSYNKLCEINKLKLKLIGIFIFISEFYKQNIIKLDIIIKYVNILLENINTSDNYEKYIECFSELIINIGEKIENENKKYFQSEIISKIEKIINNKKKYNSRCRFKLLDLIDLYKNNWVKI